MTLDEALKLFKKLKIPITSKVIRIEGKVIYLKKKPKGKKC